MEFTILGGRQGDILKEKPVSGLFSYGGAGLEVGEVPHVCADVEVHCKTLQEENLEGKGRARWLCGRFGSW